jgi:hypothetical protein
MPQTSPIRIALACALAAAAGGFACWITTPPAPTPTPDRDARTQAPPFVPALRARADVASTAAARIAAPPPSTPFAAGWKPPFPAPGLAARVDAWAASGDPADAMRAYEAVRDCLQARREDRTPEESLTADDADIESAIGPERMARIRLQRHHADLWCRDLRSDQVEARVAWLVRAARAGVANAARDFIQEGPDGQHMLGDAGAPWPVGAESWYAQRDAYIDAALRHCDIGLQAYLAAFARLPGMTIVASDQLWRAHLQCDAQAPPPPPLRDDPLAAAALDRFQRGQPPPLVPVVDPPGAAPG